MGNIVCRRCPDCLLYHTLDIPFCECGTDLRKCTGEVIDELILPMYYGEINTALPVYQQQCPDCGSIHYTLRPVDAMLSCPNCGGSRIASVFPSLFNPLAEPPVPGQLPHPVSVQVPPDAPVSEAADGAPTDEELAEFWLRLLQGKSAHLPGQSGPDAPASASPLTAQLLRLAQKAGFREQPLCASLRLKEALVRLFTISSATGSSYRVKTFLSGFDGISVYMLCTDPAGEECVLRAYTVPVTQTHDLGELCRLLDHMQTPQGQTGIRYVRDLGLISLPMGNCYFEVLDHCPSGNLRRSPALDFGALVSLTEQLNAALHNLHTAGITHGNLCPSNIFRNGERFVLGGFRTTSPLPSEDDPMDEACCRSPESLMPVNGYRSTAQDDYYALGITLASLFDGRLVYGHLNPTEHRTAVQNNTLPLSRSHPDKAQLLNLLRGLCQSDPEKRFGWDEVCMWLKNHNYTGGSTATWPEGISILDTPCTDAQSMFQAITASTHHWDAARTQLYNGTFTDFFLPFHQELAFSAKNAAQTWQDIHPDKGLSVFLKKLLPSGPLAWCGMRFDSLEALAVYMQEADSSAALSELLRQECVSHWLDNTPDLNVEPAAVELIGQIEDLSQREPALACHWFANAFAPRHHLRLYSSSISSIRELPQVLFQSPAAFYQRGGFEKLTDRSAGADLYGFLFSLGFRRIIDDTWKDIRSAGTFDRFCELMLMLDRILVSADADPRPLRQFFVQYGPLGAAVYARELALQEDPPVYTPISSSGDTLLSRIREFAPPTSGTAEELLNAYMPLLELTRELSRSMSSNPFDTGSSYSIRCSNLKGCFNAVFLDMSAPLGLPALLEHE